jgi:hypothetical protein
MIGKNDFADNRLHSPSPHQSLFPELEWQHLNGENICHFACAAALHLNRK